MLGLLLQNVLHAVAAGSTVTVPAIPQEVTTSTAAAMLGISRPALMKMPRDGLLPAHAGDRAVRRAPVFAARVLAHLHRSM